MGKKKSSVSLGMCAHLHYTRPDNYICGSPEDEYNAMQKLYTLLNQENITVLSIGNGWDTQFRAARLFFCPRTTYPIQTGIIWIHYNSWILRISCSAGLMIDILFGWLSNEGEFQHLAARDEDMWRCSPSVSVAGHHPSRSGPLFSIDSWCWLPLAWLYKFDCFSTP